MEVLRNSGIRFLMALGWSLALIWFHIYINLTRTEAAWLTVAAALIIVVGTFIGASMRGGVNAWLLSALIPIGLGLTSAYSIFYLAYPLLYTADIFG